MSSDENTFLIVQFHLKADLLLHMKQSNQLLRIQHVSGKMCSTADTEHTVFVVRVKKKRKKRTAFRGRGLTHVGDGSMPPTTIVKILEYSPEVCFGFCLQTYEGR